MSSLIRRWLPPLVWMGLIFFFSAQPSLPSIPGFWDLLIFKSMHVMAYAILTWLYLRALRGTAPAGAPVRLVGAALALAYAASDEYHQTFVPGRNGSLVDVGIDAVGILGVILLDWRIRTKRRGQGGAVSR